MKLEKKRLLKYCVVGLCVLMLAAVCIVVYRMIVFRLALGPKYLDDLRIESPDGQYTLIVREWGAAGGTGADIYQQKGNGETKLGETASKDSVYPFRDGQFEAEWGDAWVRVIWAAVGFGGNARSRCRSRLRRCVGTGGLCAVWED